MQIPISRRGGGGIDLNFTIVGGTTQPENPKENTIWVNTATEITKWSFNVSKPSEPIEGMIWFPSTTTGTTFNTLAENEISVSANACSQYILGTWTEVSAMIYCDEAWKDLWGGQLFDNGNTYDEITGGWTPCAMGGRTLNMSSSYISNVMRVYKTSSTSNTSAGYATVNKIDLTGYNYIEITVNSILTAGYHVKFFLTENRNNDPYNNYSAILSLSKTGVNTLDISGLNKTKQYIALGEYSSGANAYGVDIAKITLKR
jgi:hypothetical protein